MKKTIAILALMSLSGCAWLPWWKSEEPITIVKKAQERTPLAIPDLEPLKPNRIEWIVVTPENINQIWSKLRESHVDLVLFALTDNGYELLSLDSAMARNFIQHQREIIIRYRNYYESKKEETK